MKRLLAGIRFELGFYLRRISTWVYFLVLAAASFFMMNVLGGAISGARATIGGTDGNVYVNSPYVLVVLTTVFALFGILVVAAVAGNAGYRDFGTNMHALIFTTPTSRFEYVATRFVASFLINCVVVSGIGFGLWLGSIVPWIDADRFGPNSFAAYLRPYLLVVYPNVLFATALFLTMALLTRKRLPHFLGGAGLLLSYLLARSTMRDLETKWIGALTDPFGNTAVSLATEYWTTIEKNTRLLGFEGWILPNRLIWMGLALAVVAFSMWRFRFSQVARESRRRRKGDLAVEAATPRKTGRVEIPSARRDYGLAAHWAQFRTLTRRSFSEVVVSPYFAAIVLGGVLFLVMSATQLETIFGTRTWPMAWKVIEVLGGSFGLFVVVLITFYAGELVWRERDLKLDQVVDASPTPSWVGYLSKLATLGGVVGLLMLVVTFAGMLTQAVFGFFRFEPLLYAQKLFGMGLIDYGLLCVLALAVHTLVNHKYAGHFILILFYVGVDLLPLMGLEHPLWRYGSDLGAAYSDMNRHGWFLGPFVWFKLYWAGFAVLLAVLSNLLWPRGVDHRVKQRLGSARLRMRVAVTAMAVLGVSVAFGAGGYIFYNTNVLNSYRGTNAQEALLADYEKQYKQYDGLAQPRITDVSLEVDLFPASGNVSVRGSYRFVNRSGEPIERVHMLLIPEAEIAKLELGIPSELELLDEDRGYRIFALEQALPPGESSTLEFDIDYPRHGFSTEIERTVVENGSFVNSAILPSFGYNPDFELSLDRARKKYHLEPKERMRDLDDPQGKQNNYISLDADWVNFDVVVSTTPDQIALAPGYLQREWEEDGRRFFHYEMDAPILNFFSFLSARYEVVRDRWNEVAIEVYYHPGHEFNLERMVDSVKTSLAYFSEVFSPYQHRQLRILEFPRYASFAQSFPNTIPYSESIGFIARVKEDDIDYPFYVTAHEVAHQWWAHQIIGANVQGSTTLSETLSQYSALMVMEQEFGPDKIRRFLEYELDAYLRGRSEERKKEVPLLRVENQPYIHYNKGSLVMYALRDAIGEEAVNRALSGLLEEWAFKGPPYPTSRDLLEALVAETPEELRTWVVDMFEHIELYENRATEAVARMTDDGRYEVTLSYESRKIRAGEQGEETEVGLNDLIDIGVFDDAGDPLYLEKHRIDGDSGEVTVVVDGEPARAGIDPYHKLIDRHPDDNEVPVETDEG